MAVASLIVSLTAALVTFALAWYARATLVETKRADERMLEQARIANSLPTVANFLREFRETSADRNYIVNEMRREFPVPLPLSDLPDSVRARVLPASHYLDNLGVLVERRLVEPETIAGFLGDSIIALWEALQPFVQAEREKRKGDYQEYFEDLAARMAALGPAEARKGLQPFPAAAPSPYS